MTLVAAKVERERGARAAALLSFVAVAVGLAALHDVARPANWWTFAPVEGAFRGMPVDLWLGWSALWGPVPVLLRRVVPLPVALGLLLWLDAATMPALRPLVHLGPHWLLGEAVGLLAVALPAQLLGRWSADRRHLGARVLLQLTVFAGMTLWLVPTAAFELGDGSWARLTHLSGRWLFVIAQVGLLLAVPALSAVWEFAVRGGGTPYPWDPPRRLVATGPYAYLANPMQVSAVTLVLLIAAVTRSISLVAAALIAVAFSAGVAGPHEHDDLSNRLGQDWHEYRRNVRDWWPRWTPYLPGTPAVLWLDDDCGPCTATAGFLRRRRPGRLTLAPAQEYERPLWRAQYAGGDGHSERGVAAVARGLEHVNLGWAYVGWLLRLPGIGWLAQVVTDAMIAPPHLAGPPAARTRGEGCPTPSFDCSPGHSPPSGSTASPASPPVPSPPPPA
nr:methyltransferase [Planosporangium flavigriseum]